MQESNIRGAQEIFPVEFDLNKWQILKKEEWYDLHSRNCKYKIVYPENNESGIIISVRFTCATDMQENLQNKFIQDLIGFLDAKNS